MNVKTNTTDENIARLEALVGQMEVAAEETVRLCTAVSQVKDSLTDAQRDRLIAADAAAARIIENLEG